MWVLEPALLKILHPTGFAAYFVSDQWRDIGVKDLQVENRAWTSLAGLSSATRARPSPTDPRQLVHQVLEGNLHPLLAIIDLQSVKFAEGKKA